VPASPKSIVLIALAHIEPLEAQWFALNIRPNSLSRLAHPPLLPGLLVELGVAAKSSMTLS